MIGSVLYKKIAQVRLLSIKNYIQFRNVPVAQAALALAVIALGQAWVLYFPTIGGTIRPYLALLGAGLLAPVIVKYITNTPLFISDLKHPLNGSLMAPITMGLLILADYLAMVSPIIAYPLWFIAIIAHISLLTLFFFFQLKSFKITNIYPSWFLYPVGLISSSLAGSKFGHDVFSVTLVNICVTVYFFMLPLILYRLLFEGPVPRKAKPTLAIMAAPINLALASYLVNFQRPDPILTGALAGIAITMTLVIYLSYFRLLKQKFQPSIAALTFPSVISTIAMYRLTDFFDASFPQWKWLHTFGFMELFVATLLVIWVTYGYLKAYWPKIDRPALSDQ